MTKQNAATATTTRPLRADAARNRAAIVAVAADIFATTGTDASLEDIAHKADVGIGTLYRHFPTRGSLIEQVYRSLVDELCATAPTLLETREPFKALEEWVLSFTEYVGRKRGVVASLRAALGDEKTTVFADSHAKLQGAAKLLLDAAHRDGSIRSDVDPMDMLRAVGGLCMMGGDQDNPQEAAERTRRMLGLVLDGLRYGAPA